MSRLLAANPCDDGEQICDQVFDWTGNATAADVADLVIGKPLAIVGLLLLGLAVRWLLHRLVDRVIRRAETGVLTDRVNHAALTRRVQRAKTMGSLLKSIISGVLVAVFGDDDPERARSQHRPDRRQRRHHRYRPGLRRPVAGK